MRPARPILLLPLLLALASCASDDTPEMSVGSTYDPLTRFPAAATWIWDEAAIRLPDDDRIRAFDIDAILRELAADEFGRRGYTQVGAESPSNYLLSYEISVATWHSRTEATAIAAVSLSLRERGSRRRVWLGFVRAPVHAELSREERTERIREELRELLETFPPGPAH